MDLSQTQEMQRGFASILSAQPNGAGATLITVESDVSRGLHSFSIVGLTDRAVTESRERIASAIRHSGFDSPKSTNKRIVLSLSPANLKKEGSHYDVSLALSYLIASGHLPPQKEQSLFLGELALNGTIRPVTGVLSMVLEARNHGIRSCIVPYENAEEAALAPDIVVYACHSLKEVLGHVKEVTALTPYVRKENCKESSFTEIDLGHIRGQESAKRACIIAAAGRHNCMMYGPPGTGKTLLANALRSILPQLSHEESIETTAIHSNAGILAPGKVVMYPPFRNPHHSASCSAMIGGGRILRAGEITLAHNGVLFLDEFPEFSSQTLEALRQPLENHKVSIARANGHIILPARCMLVGAMNPADTLSTDAAVNLRHVQTQRKKISRPIADRIDMWISVPEVPPKTILEAEKGLSSSEAQQIVSRVHLLKRSTRAQLATTEQARKTLIEAAEKLSLSARSLTKIKSVAETIAYIEESSAIDIPHILEALQYRPRGIVGID